MKNTNLFWIGFSDIMISLFFIMLVLFVVTAGFYYNKYQIAQDKLNQIDNIETALSSLDKNYFDFDEENKRYRLNIDIRFEPNEANIYVADNTILNNLEGAGKTLYKQINEILEENKGAYLLLVIEGNTQRYEDNFVSYPDTGYRLSYNRALALYNFWKDKGLNFYDFGDRCEIIIAGSGYFGISRDKNERLNRRFTLQITSKYTLEVNE